MEWTIILGLVGLLLARETAHHHTLVLLGQLSEAMKDLSTSLAIMVAHNEEQHRNLLDAMNRVERSVHELRRN